MDADHEHPGLISDEMRSDGITFVVIGIGSGTNQTEIDHIAGGPDNAFSAASFDELVGGEFIGMLRDKTCKVGMFHALHDKQYFINRWFLIVNLWPLILKSLTQV